MNQPSLAGFFIAIAVSLPCLAEPVSQPATELTATPVRVALFKNGLGLISSEVKLPPKEGLFRVSPLPDATLGTFWLRWSKGVTLDGIRATRVMAADQAATSIAEMLEANIGKSVEIRVGDKWRPVKVRDVPRLGEDSSGRDVYGNPIPVGAFSMGVPPRSQLVIVEEGDAVSAIAIGTIQEVKVPAKDAALMVERPRKVMEFHATPLPGAGENPLVEMTYLAQSVAWSPSYTVDISDEKKAVLTGKAIIINDLMPLEKVQVELIAGYPNLEFSGVRDAFTLTPLSQILDQIRSRSLDTQRGMVANSMMSQQASYRQNDRGGLAAGPAGPVMGEGSEDLYFYPVKDVTLKKGERGYFGLFTAPLDYQHIYTWEIADFIDQEERYSSRGNPEMEQTQVVWHALKLTNTTAQPWTTGPAETIKNGRVLGQSTLSYTPPNATTELRITQVAAVNAEQSESEVERKRNAAQFYGSTFDLITVKGELQITNYTGKAMTIQVTKTLSGEIQKTDGEPKITKLAKGLRKVNPRSQLVWSVPVEAGKDKSVCVTYTYQVYVRN